MNAMHQEPEFGLIWSKFEQMSEKTETVNHISKAEILMLKNVTLAYDKTLQNVLAREGKVSSKK